MGLHKKNVAAISAAVIGFGLMSHAAFAGVYANITIDGSFSDWTNIPVAASTAPGGAAPNIVALKVANDSNYIYMEFTYASPTDPTGTYIGIDSDNNPNTGYNIYSSPLIGANAAFQNDFPFTQSSYYDNSTPPVKQEVFNSQGTFNNNQGLNAGPAYFSNASTLYEEVAIPIGATEIDTSPGGYNGLVFQTSTNSFTVEAYTGSSVVGPYLYTIAAPTAVYVPTGSADYNLATSWSTGVPNGVGVEADFLGSITANHTVYSDTSITAGKIVFNNSFTYVLAGAGDLTLATSSGSAVVDAQQGIQKITLPITIASNTTFQAESGATLVIGAPVTVNSGETLSQSGAGTVQYISTIDVLNGGSLSLAAGSHIASLTLEGASTAALIAETGTTKTALTVDSLSIATGSTFDLHNGDLIVHNGGLSTVAGSVKSGGIVSSVAAADPTHLTALGVIQNISNGTAIYSTFDQTPVTSGDVLVKYTYYGDSNLDGAVDGSDYTLIDHGFNSHLSGWYNGDYNYDGVVDGSDYTLIDNAFNTQGLSLGINPAATVAAEIAGTSVPEPASLSLVIAAAAGMLSRRRRGL